MVLSQPESAVVLAVDVRVEQVAVDGGSGRAGDRAPQLEPAPLHQTPGEVITHVAESAQLLAGELAVTPAGAGISAPGVVRRDDGWVHEAPNLEWRDVALGTRLAAVLRLPVQVANDAELGALAEHVRVVARDVAAVVYISADKGVGGGVISAGRPLRGIRGYVGGPAIAAPAAAGRPVVGAAELAFEPVLGAF